LVKIVDLHSEKMKIAKRFVKTPIALVNNDYVGLAWMKGEYRLHRHEVDEFFLVLEGHLTIEVDGKTHELDPFMGITIPKGVPHMSKSQKETLVAIFEPQGVKIEYLD